MPNDQSNPAHPELGFYTLAGGAQNPRDLVQEIQDAEALGLGAVFISERFNVKEAVTLSGAAAVASTNMQIITGATNHNTRHPIVTASYATPTGSALFSAEGYTTVDLRVLVRLPDLGFAEGTELGLQVNDLFDATPPFFPGTDGIGGTYNPIGRYAAMSLRTSF